MNEGVPSNPIDKNTKWNKIPQIAWFTLFILGSVDLISTAGETMIIPAIPDIINEFNITYSDSSWILSSYLAIRDLNQVDVRHNCGSGRTVSGAWPRGP